MGNERLNILQGNGGSFGKSSTGILLRAMHSFIASFSYDYQPNLQLGLDYQFALANFTVVKRDDQYHQIAARLTYTAFRNTQMNVFIGYSFGRSSDPTIAFNGLILGVSLTVNLGLF